MSMSRAWQSLTSHLSIVAQRAGLVDTVLLQQLLVPRPAVQRVAQPQELPAVTQVRGQTVGRQVRSYVCVCVCACVCVCVCCAYLRAMGSRA